MLCRDLAGVDAHNVLGRGSEFADVGTGKQCIPIWVSVKDSTNGAWAIVGHVFEPCFVRADGVGEPRAKLTGLDQATIPDLVGSLTGNPVHVVNVRGGNPEGLIYIAGGRYRIVGSVHEELAGWVDVAIRCYN